MSEEIDAHVRETVAILHVFSGVHLGAQIELAAGTWLLGSDDACDLILMGLAPRHARLTVRAESEVQVLAAPEAGALFVDGEEVQEEVSLVCGQAWYLADTCFAWNLPHVQQETIIPQKSFAQASNASVRTNGGEEDALSQATEEPVQTAEPVERVDPVQPEADFQPVSMEAPPAKQPRSFWEKWRRPLPLLVLAFLLVVLSITFSTGPSRGEYPEIVGKILTEAGFADLAVTPRWPGVEVRGSVPTSADLERLSSAVGDVSFPVYLEVAVDNDLLQAVRNALGVRGFSPVVTMVRRAGEARVRIAAFMRDSLVEAEAFGQLEKDVPSPPFKERRILHEDEVVPIILAALHKEHLENIRPVCLPGRITLTGNFSFEVRQILEELKAKLSAQFGIPLFGENIFVASEPAVRRTPQHSEKSANLHLPAAQSNPAANKDTFEAGKVPHASDPLGGLKVTGVFTAPLLFIITDDGKRFFQGAILPNGNVLERITSSELTLRSANGIISYPLRGPHE
ncbi:MAG: type III secretion system inner membrane ring subunit SctD [Desulfovibrio sp.]|nr:type III secretion system inner membrane ring subunit SctD [Desulfovibrio sp.]